MSNSIFDWDNEDEQKPAATEPAASEPSDLIHELPSAETTAPPPVKDSWASFDDQDDPLEIGPAPFEYSSDPFHTPPPPPQPYYSSDPFQEPADHSEQGSRPEFQPDQTQEFRHDYLPGHDTDPEPEPSAFDTGMFGYDTVISSNGSVETENNQYPFGYEPAPFEPPPPGMDYQPESKEETSRRSSLAFSAAIVFFSSVVFMLFLGWIADWLIGSSPWGLVGGIVLGSVIGIIQFVRITSSIFNTSKSDSAMHPLLLPDDDEE